MKTLYLISEIVRNREAEIPNGNLPDDWPREGNLKAEAES